MNPEHRLEFYRAAVRALMGQDGDDNFKRIAEAIELEHRRGVAKGYDQGYDDGAAGYQPAEFPYHAGR